MLLCVFGFLRDPFFNGPIIVWELMGAFGESVVRANQQTTILKIKIILYKIKGLCFQDEGEIDIPRI